MQSLCLKMDRSVNTEIIEDSGDSRPSRYSCVGDSQELRHDKGPCSHDGGHNLAASRSGRFHCPCKLFPISEAFHEWDIEHSIYHDIGYSATRNSPKESGGETGDFGGAAMRSTCQFQGKVHKGCPSA